MSLRLSQSTLLVETGIPLGTFRFAERWSGMRFPRCLELYFSLLKAGIYARNDCFLFPNACNDRISQLTQAASASSLMTASGRHFFKIFSCCATSLSALCQSVKSWTSIVTPTIFCIESLN